MAEGESTLADEFRRYAAMVEAAMRPLPVFAAEAESVDAIQVERGLVFGYLMLDSPVDVAALMQRLMSASSGGRLGKIGIVDRLGHARPVYRALLIYAWAMAYRVGYETLPSALFGRWEEDLRAWADDLEQRLGGMSLPGNAAPAAQGNLAVEACWIALALYAAGRVLSRDAWGDLASVVFGRLPHWQRDSGAFLEAGHSDNPDTHAFDELAILHAAASYAVQSEDRALAAHVARSTLYCQEQIQADHATTQPWGLFAFVWNRSTRTTGEGLLHAAGIAKAQAGAADAVGLLLMADALYCLRLFDMPKNAPDKSGG